MDPEQRSRPQKDFDKEEFLDKLSEFTHIDDQGNLISDHAEMEIGNKVGAASSKFFVLKMSGMNKEELDDLGREMTVRLISTFDQVGYKNQVMDKLEQNSQLRDYLPQEDQED